MSMGYLLGDSQVLKQPKNPMDRCTIVSIFPCVVEDRKVTLDPGYFKIEAGSFQNPAVLIVGSSSWYRAMYETNEVLEIPNSSILIAEDLINGYCNSAPDAIVGAAIPGLFYVVGEKTQADIKLNHKTELEAARIKQNAYWKNCINSADKMWARSNGNPMAISDQARIAVRELGIDPKSKPWMGTIEGLANIANCPACGAMINKQFPVCSNCKTVIDKKRAEELGLTFAK